MDPREEFRVYMKAASRGLEDSSPPHVSDDDLIAYQRDRLVGSERSRIQHHFSQCSSCFDRFKDVSDFFSPARRDEESPGEEMIAQEWETLRRQLPPQEIQSANTARQRRRSFFIAPRTLALAAMILVILTAGWGFWMVNQRDQLAREFEREQQALTRRLQELDDENRRLKGNEDEAIQKEGRLRELEKEKQQLQEQVRTYESQIAQLQQPELNSQIFDIDEQDSPQRSTVGRSRNSVLITRRAKTVTLILNGADQPEHPNYDIELVNQKGQVSWRREGLKRDNFGNFVVTLYRASLGEGQVLLKVYGRSAKRSDLIGQYSVSIRVQD